MMNSLILPFAAFAPVFFGRSFGPCNPVFKAAYFIFSIEPCAWNPMAEDLVQECARRWTVPHAGTPVERDRLPLLRAYEW